MKLSIFLILINFFALHYFSNSNDVTSIDPGRLLASNCFQCHGTNMCGLENLAGTSASEIIDEMEELSMKNPREEIMNVHALGYTSTEVALIADYISTLNCQEPIITNYTEVLGNRLDNSFDHSVSKWFRADQILESEALITGDVYIEYEASERIELFPSFSVEPGSIFEVDIQNCNY